MSSVICSPRKSMHHEVAMRLRQRITDEEPSEICTLRYEMRAGKLYEPQRIGHEQAAAA